MEFQVHRMIRSLIFSKELYSFGWNGSGSGMFWMRTRFKNSKICEA